MTVRVSYEYGGPVSYSVFLLEVMGHVFGVFLLTRGMPVLSSPQNGVDRYSTARPFLREQHRQRGAVSRARVGHIALRAGRGPLSFRGEDGAGSEVKVSPARG